LKGIDFFKYLEPLSASGFSSPAPQSPGIFAASFLEIADNNLLHPHHLLKSSRTLHQIFNISRVDLPRQAVLESKPEFSTRIHGRQDGNSGGKLLPT
jgi:hypothetical protein